MIQHPDWVLHTGTPTPQPTFHPVVYEHLCNDYCSIFKMHSKMQDTAQSCWLNQVLGDLPCPAEEHPLTKWGHRAEGLLPLNPVIATSRVWGSQH